MKTQPDKKQVRDEAVKLSKLQNKLWESGSYYDGTKLRKVVLDFFSEELAAKFGQNIVVTYDNKNSKFEFKMLPLGFDSQEAVTKKLGELEKKIEDLKGEMQTTEVAAALKRVTSEYEVINASLKQIEQVSQSFGATLSKISEQFNAKYHDAVKPIINQSERIAREIDKGNNTRIHRNPNEATGAGEKTAKISAFTGLASLAFLTVLSIGAAASIFFPQLHFAQSLLFSKVGVAAGASVAGSFIGFFVGVELYNNERRNEIWELYTPKDVKPDSYLGQVLGDKGNASIFNIIETTVEGLANEVNAAMGTTVFPNTQQLGQETVTGVTECLYPQLQASAPPMSPIEAIQYQIDQIQGAQVQLGAMLTTLMSSIQTLQAAEVAVSANASQGRGQN